MENPFVILATRLENIETLLQDIRKQPEYQADPPDTHELLTVQDAAAFLRLSVTTVYGLISKGQLPAMKRSKRCYFTKVDLINYLKQGRKKTLTETAYEASQYCKSTKTEG